MAMHWIATPVKLVRFQYGTPICVYGGMVDAPASKAGSRKRVMVRVHLDTPRGMGELVDPLALEASERKLISVRV